MGVSARCAAQHALMLFAALSSPLLLGAQASATTQVSGPNPGSWAAEGVVGSVGVGASVLRFRSTQSAWIVGMNASGVVRREDIAATPFQPADRVTIRSASVDLRLGQRRYASPGMRLRPLAGAGVLGSYQGGGGLRLWAAGIYGEGGAAFFFSPHVSLGASGEVRLVYDEQRGGNVTAREVMLRATLARLLGTVYF
jgi:hypothetical protein